MENDTIHVPPVIFDQKTLEKAMHEHGATAIQELGRRAFEVMMCINEIPREYKVVTVGLDKQSIQDRFLNIPSLVLSTNAVVGKTDSKVVILETTYTTISEPITFYLCGWIEERSLLRHCYTRKIHEKEVKCIERGFISVITKDHFKHLLQPPPSPALTSSPSTTTSDSDNDNNENKNRIVRYRYVNKSNSKWNR
jgi:hypothetical protein